MYRLLGRKTSGNVQKVLVLLEHIGADYTREDYGRQFGNTGAPEYLALNPTGKVPTLVDGEVVIWESHSILRYLAAVAAPNLTGANPAERAEVERWMDFLLAAVNPGYMAAFKGASVAPAERAPEYGAATADLVAQMVILNARLAGRPYLALGRVTIADIACGPILKRCLGYALERPALPGLDDWLARMELVPAFAKVTA